MDQKTVSIVVPTFNRRDSLRNTLLSLVHQTYPPQAVEVIVVDNCSSDGTGEMIASLETPYRIQILNVKKEKAFESSRVRNIGIRAAQGEVIIFLDSDMIVPRRFVEQHMAFHEKVPWTAVLGKMIYLESNESLRDCVILSDFRAEQLGKAHLAGDTVKRFLEFCGNLPQYSRPWDFCIGANFSVSRSTIERAGSFDESMDGPLPAAADIAYGLQLYSSGIRLAYGRAAIGFHQKNHALSTAEAPEYFRRRQESVWAHEARVHDRWLPDREAQRIKRHIAEKRKLNGVVQKFGAKYTMQIEKGSLARIEALQSPLTAILVTVLLISDSDTASLNQSLASLAEESCPSGSFEVLVLDPEADTDELTDDYSAAAHIAVQAADVPYILRYFPTGTRQHRRMLAEIKDRYLDQEGLAIEAGLRLLASEQAAYSRSMHSLISERPLGQMVLTMRTSQLHSSSGVLSRMIAELRPSQTARSVAAAEPLLKQCRAL